MAHRSLSLIGFLLLAFLVASCGDSGTSDTVGSDDPPVTNPEPEPEPEPEDPTCEAQAYESTFDAVQQIVFDRYGCVGCHSGEAPQGSLDLSPGVAYDNLVEVPSVGSDLARIYPGARERSSLWLKVYANVDPSVTSLSPMPPSGPVPTADELELLRLWILGGAPREGTVLGTEDLLPGCLADPTPISIKPLEPLPADEGVQFVMPGVDLVASSETEVCFATYYDFSEQVPGEFKSDDGSTFFYDGYEVRQDALSHHLIFFLGTRPDGTRIEPEDISGWTCAEGDLEGAACDPRDPGACGVGGYCRTPVRTSLACVGYQQEGDQAFFPAEEIAVQQAQSTHTLYPGTYREMPIRGIALWNSHSFNLTTEDHLLRGRINLRFAKERRFPQYSAGGFDTAFGIPRMLGGFAPPYSEDVLCERMILPQGARITGMSSHTHRHGKHFWYETPDGEHIYDSFIYNDPLNWFPEDPLAFDDPDPAQRTLTYCSLFRNGVDENGNPDPEDVTRASRIEYPLPFAPGANLGLCEPTQCVNEGRYDVSCDDGIANQKGDDAACDSSPGAGDGFCDACAITGGITTENEMFGAQVWYFIAEGFPTDARVEFPDSFGFGLTGLGGGGRPGAGED